MSTKGTRTKNSRPALPSKVKLTFEQEVELIRSEVEKNGEYLFQGCWQPLPYLRQLPGIKAQIVEKTIQNYKFIPPKNVLVGFKFMRV